MADATKVPIAGQIAEVKREIALRASVYPRLIATSKMRPGEAELCTRRMEAVLATLFFCQENEAEIRAFIKAKREAAA